MSLLEASAMAKEIETRIHLLHRLKKDDRLVEETIVRRETLQNIYNEKLTEYSACFHLMANLQGEKDLAGIARYVGVLTRLVLNVPLIAFSTALKNINSYKEKFSLKSDDPSLLRMKRSMELENHGTLFYLICLFLPLGALKGDVVFYKSLDFSLKKLGLSLEKLRRGAVSEMEDLHSSLKDSENQTISELAAAGYSNFKIIYPNELSYPLDKLALPPALLGDFSVNKFSSGDHNLLRDFDLDIAYDNLIDGQIRSENFSEACR